LIEHNSIEEIKFTTRFSPLTMLLAFEVSEFRGEAIKVERFLKRQKIRTFVKKLKGSRNRPEFFQDLVVNVVSKRNSEASALIRASLLLPRIREAWGEVSKNI
jgi:putative endonuclease